VTFCADDIFSAFRYCIVLPSLADLPPLAASLCFTLITVVLIIEMLAQGVLARSRQTGTSSHPGGAAVEKC
jgi:hypothetical protein